MAGERERLILQQALDAEEALAAFRADCLPLDQLETWWQRFSDNAMSRLTAAYAEVSRLDHTDPAAWEVSARKVLHAALKDLAEQRPDFGN